MVNLELFIRKDDIKSLLKQTTNTSTKLSINNPLLYLSIVDDFLLTRGQTIDDESREYAITEIIINTISDEYQRYCDIYGISNDDRDNLERILTIVYQGGKDFSNLAGLMILYFIYVRVDTPLTQDQTITLITNVFSHLSRAREVGVTLIHKYLLEKEIMSRRKHHKRRLRQALPHNGYINLIGRDQEAGQLLEIIQQHKNVLVTGVSGVGKTTLVEAVINEIINDINTEMTILWLDLDHDSDVEAKIRAYYPYTKDFEKLKNYLSSQETLIIADNPSPAHIQYLAKNFSLAHLVIISSQVMLQTNLWGHIYKLKPFKLDSTRNFIQEIMKRFADIKLDDRTVGHIAASSEGIPQYIISLVMNYCSDHIEITRYVDNYLGLLGHAWLDINAIIDFWSPDINLDDIINNPHIEIIVIDGRSHARIRSNIFIQFNTDVISSIYGAIERNRLLDNEIFPDVIYGLMRHGIEVSEIWLDHVFNHYSKRVDNWITWLEFALLNTHNNDIYEAIIIRLSRYYRRIGQPQRYIDQLESSETIESHIELLRCMRATGQYERAFDKLFYLMKSSHDTTIKHELSLLTAQLYVDVGNLEEAAKLLQRIQPLKHWPEYRLTYAELELQIYGNINIDIYSDYGDLEQSTVESHYQYLMGSRHFATQAELSLEHFLRGLQLVSQQPIRNKIIVGRYLSNIGACYVKLGRHPEADLYLSQALEMQKSIGDQLGVLYTEKSLQSLRTQTKE